jgi:mannosyltransferase
MDAAGKRSTGAVLIVGPALLAAALCLFELSTRSLGFDEGASVAIASQHGAALWHGIAHDGGNMAGYYVLLHVLIGIFGNTPVVLRLPSALAIGASTALVSALALRLFDRRAALAAGLLCAVSLPLVFWGQSARSYALLVALTAGSFLAFVALADGRRERVGWAAYVLCTALAIYMSLMAVLIILAQFVVLGWRRERLRLAASTLPAIALCCVPLMVLVARRGSGQLFWVPRPNWTGSKQVLEALTSAGLEPNIHATATTTALLGITIVLLIAIAAIVVWGRPSWGSLLITSWLLVPVALAFLESFVGQPIFLPRNLLICVPAAALVLGWGLTRPQVPVALTVGSVAGLIALRALQLAPSYGVSPEDWRGATAHVLSESRPGDCVAFYPSDGRQAFEYYLASRERTRSPRPVLPSVPFSEVRTFVEDYATLGAAQLSAVHAGCLRLWFIASHEGQANGPGGSRANWARYLRLRAALTAAYTTSTAASFGYAAPVTVQLFAR